VEGWGMFALKEKLKMIKVQLKEWHKRHTKSWYKNQRSQGRLEEA
jgi:hypothetical protein